METNKIGKAFVSGAKTVCATIVLFIMAEGAFNDTNAAINDVVNTGTFIKNKLRPKVPAKRGVFKEDEADLYKGVWTSDGAPIEAKKLEKLREKNNYKTTKKEK